MKEKYGYITLLSTNNYLYGCIGLMYSWKATNPKYPFYCIVTEDITEENIRILTEIGFNVIRDTRYIPQSYLSLLKEYESTGEYKTPVGHSSSDLTANGWQHAWSKLNIFKYEQFDKLLFVDCDSYIIKNLDHLFSRPGWSATPEYDAPWRKTRRFHTAFFLIEPSMKVYNELTILAEENPLILHPATGQYQLSNDYDLLNLYKPDWGNQYELSIPNYVYLDSYTLQTSDFFFPFLINSFFKTEAIHLSGPKPWLCGTKEVENYSGEWSLWREMYLLYIRFVNKAIEDMLHKGVANLLFIE
jgi:hypothetical protein